MSDALKRRHIFENSRRSEMLAILEERRAKQKSKNLKVLLEALDVLTRMRDETIDEISKLREADSEAHLNYRLALADAKENER